MISTTAGVSKNYVFVYLFVDNTTLECMHEKSRDENRTRSPIISRNGEYFFHYIILIHMSIYTQKNL